MDPCPLPSAGTEKPYNDEPPHDTFGQGIMAAPGHDAEKKHDLDNPVAAPRRRSIWEESRGDPFGDESDAQIKYRTMAWW